MIGRLLQMVILMLSTNACATSLDSSSTMAIKSDEVAKFTVYDATLYKNKPDLKSYNIVALPVLYVSRIWPDWKKLSKRERDVLPVKEHVTRVAKKFPGNDGRVVVDVEHWNIRAKGVQLRRNLNKYEQLISWFKEANPDVEWGYFARPPVRDYTRSTLGEGHYKYRRWQAHNNQFRDLSKLVDVIYPSLYTKHNDHEGWVKYAKANIEEARRLSDGKPVVAFIWPRYKNSNLPYTGRYISDEFFRLQLETVYKYADGVAIWGGWGASTGKALQWTSDMKWFSVLKKFIEEKQLD